MTSFLTPSKCGLPFVVEGGVLGAVKLTLVWRRGRGGTVGAGVGAGDDDDDRSLSSLCVWLLSTAAVAGVAVEVLREREDRDGVEDVDGKRKCMMTTMTSEGVGNVGRSQSR